MYYLYYLLLRISSDLCATIVQLYCTYYLYYLVIRASSDLCEAYLYYFVALTKILRALAELTQFVPATASCRMPPLRSQWWRSRSHRLPSTVTPPVLPCPHWVQCTDQSYKSCPSKPCLTNTPSAMSLTCPSKTFLNRHTNSIPVRQSHHYSTDYLPIKTIFEPTNQSNPCETVLSFPNRLPIHPSHFLTHIPNQALWDIPVIPHQIIFPSKPFSNRHANPKDVIQSCRSSTDYLPLQAIFGPTLQSLWASTVITNQITYPSKPFLNQHAKPSALNQSWHSSLDSSFINDSSVINHFFSASVNASSADFFTSCLERLVSKAFFGVFMGSNYGEFLWGDT